MKFKLNDLISPFIKRAEREVERKVRETKRQIFLFSMQVAVLGIGMVLLIIGSVLLLQTLIPAYIAALLMGTLCILIFLLIAAFK